MVPGRRGSATPWASHDRGEVIRVLDSLEVPAGRFRTVLVVQVVRGQGRPKWTRSYYGRAVGLIRRDDLELVEYGFIVDDDDDDEDDLEDNDD